MAALVFAEAFEAADSKDVFEPTKLFGYTVVGKLGSGVSSTIYDVGDDLALKIPENKDYLTEGHLNLVELTIMCGMEHPNILSGKLRISQSGGIGILMQKIDKTILATDLSYIERLSAIYQIGMALLFLHDNGYAHFDIKPDNILYDVKTSRAKLIDFNLSSLLDSNGTCRRLEVITLTYRPLENLGQEVNDVYGKDSDVWSFAITMLHILGGSKFYLPRFGNQDEYRVFLTDNLTEAKFDAFILSLLPTEIHNTPLTMFVITLLRKVLLPPRKDRLTLRAFLSDPLFALYRTRECYEFDLGKYDASNVEKIIASVERKLCFVFSPSPSFSPFVSHPISSSSPFVSPTLPTLPLPRKFPLLPIPRTSVLPPLPLPISFGLSMSQGSPFPEIIPLLSVGKVESITCPVVKETPYPMLEFVKLAVAIYGPITVPRKIPISVLFLAIDIAYRTFRLREAHDMPHTHAITCLFIAMKYIAGFPINIEDAVPKDVPVVSVPIILMENKIVEMLGGVIYRPYFYSKMESVGQMKAVLELIVPFPDRYYDLTSLNAIVVVDHRPKESLYLSDMHIVED